ncbi:MULTISPECIES: phosphoribosyltransferase domain-containing protein [unclassified Psychrobacter]|uniref:phosphoribosyltransferase domain-containing protein n=1 Tax=unclassified Psychrobacter TaxID=196806 RepID=UPI003F46DCCB
MSSQQQHTTIALPRGTLSLTYQTKGVTSDNDLEQNDHYQLEDLLGFAQRINPKRAFLFVSKVLGRHIPVAPTTMRQAFTDLANSIPSDLPEPILVIGMAETAVGLSAGVHQALQTRYPNAFLLNSTRHAQHADGDENALLTTFSEDHSHASQHLIYKSADKAIQAQLLASRTLVMVDDEASTGNTCINVVTALRNSGLSKLEQVHLTTLVDWSLNQTQTATDADEPVSDQVSACLPNIDFQRHHLLSGTWQWTDTPNPRAIIMPPVDTTDAGSQPLGNTGNWGRFPTLDSTDGFADYLLKFQKAFTHFSGHLQFEQKQLPERILVLGSNEFVWLPFLLAEWLEKETQIQGSETVPAVKFSALTRSPIAPGGAISTMMSFNDNYGLGMTNFVYNVEPKDWDLIVLCVETPADSVDGMWQSLDNVLVVSPTF